jgi:hypothetical protein
LSLFLIALIRCKVPSTPIRLSSWKGSEPLSPGNHVQVLRSYSRSVPLIEACSGRLQDMQLSLSSSCSQLHANAAKDQWRLMRKVCRSGHKRLHVHIDSWNVNHCRVELTHYIATQALTPPLIQCCGNVTHFSPQSAEATNLASASGMSMQTGSSSAELSLNLMTIGLPLSPTTSTSILAGSCLWPEACILQLLFEYSSIWPC